jgi:hypothetical protein
MNFLRWMLAVLMFGYSLSSAGASASLPTTRSTPTCLVVFISPNFHYHYTPPAQLATQVTQQPRQEKNISSQFLFIYSDCLFFTVYINAICALLIFIMTGR